MEEVAHVFLGHTPNRLAAVASDRSSGGGIVARDYNHDDEEAAYAVGAAALVPYGPLQRFVRAGRAAADIARHFGVSRQLVEYRIKVSRLWPEYKETSAARAEHV